MQPNRVSVIIAGNWNPRIFTPSWIKTRLLGLAVDKEIEGLVNFDDMDFAFRYDGITIMPKYHSLELNVETVDEKNVLLASGVIIKVFEMLPQTPIKGMGVNLTYSFKDTDTNEYLKALKGIKKDFGAFIMNQVRHSLNKESYTINIVSDLIVKPLRVNFNFHYSRKINFDANFINEHLKETNNILTNGN